MLHFSKTTFHGINFMIHWRFYLQTPFAMYNSLNTKLLGEPQRVPAVDFTATQKKPGLLSAMLLFHKAVVFGVIRQTYG